jgi:dipeptidyl aminopeptidase/acylaminoacyl peptidase
MPARHAALAVILACACAAAAPSAGAVPGAPAPAGAAPRWKWTPEVIADMTVLGDAAISPDGTRVVYTTSRPRPDDAPPGAAYTNLWVISASGGAPRRLTTADADDHDPAWSPDGRAIAFLSARGGDKAKTRVFVMPADGGEPWPLSGEKSDAKAFAWSRDGSRIAWIAPDPKSEEREKEEKAGRDWEVADQDERPQRIWIAPAPAGGAAPGAEPVSALGEYSAWQVAWSPDGSALVATVTDTPRTDDSYMKKRIVVLPLAAGGRARELVGVVGKVDSLVWSRDGAAILYRGGVDGSDPQAGSLFSVPAGGGEKPVNWTGDRAETVKQVVWADGTRAVVAVTQGTHAALIQIDRKEHGARTVLIAPGEFGFEGASASDDGRRFALVASTGARPGEVVVAGPAGGRRTRAGSGAAAAGGTMATQVVTDLNPQIHGLPIGRQETFRWKASDGLDIEGVLTHPSGDLKRESYPLVVIVHGGPEYEMLDEWNTRYSEPVQALAERGFYVLCPNYRGSTGRGVAFSKGDHGDLGGREFRDVLDGIAALGAAYRIDLKRVGMTGGSYGGYFTSLAVTRYSPHFAAGVALFGISDWLSFLGNSAVHWDLWCYDHLDQCLDASAVGHIAEANTPTLILQGREDARVPKAQGDELYAALKWKGVPAEYVVFPREKHGFSERAHRIETTRRLLAWFEKYLKP